MICNSLINYIIYACNKWYVVSVDRVDQYPRFLGGVKDEQDNVYSLYDTTN